MIAALEALGKADLVHRDLKPDNIVLRGGRWDDPVLVDFGLAKRSYDASLTRTGDMVGTPAYMAPESILGSDLDFRTDQFALGLVIRFASCGDDVFPGLSSYETLNALVSRPVPIPRTLSPTLRSLLRRLTRIDRDQRYPCIADLRFALEGLDSNEPAQNSGNPARAIAVSASP